MRIRDEFGFVIEKMVYSMDEFVRLQREMFDYLKHDHYTSAEERRKMYEWQYDMPHVDYGPVKKSKKKAKAKCDSRGNAPKS